MASFTLKPHHQQQTQLQLTAFTHIKSYPTLNIFNFQLSYTTATKNTSQFHVKARVARQLANTPRLSTKNDKEPVSDRHSAITDNFGSFSFPSVNETSSRKTVPIERRVILKDRNAKKQNKDKVKKDAAENKSNDKSGRVLVSESNNDKVKKDAEKKTKDKGVRVLVSENNNGKVVVEKKQKGTTKKIKVEPPDLTLKIGLELCSKRGNVLGAIKLYELAKKESIKMGQYHFAVLLYLCSSAATGMVQPAKSGNTIRLLSSGDPLRDNSDVSSGSSVEFDELKKMSYSVSPVTNSSLNGEQVIGNHVDEFTDVSSQTLEGLVQELKKSAELAKKSAESRVIEIQISEDVKRLALQKGFEIYNDMRVENVPMNEATFTSVARMAMAFEDGDMAFDMVKQMKEYGINPRLRSYGPALAIFCSKGDVEKAFMVESHMLSHSVYPEEPELAALLKVSIDGKKSDKVYYVMHKLRTSIRQVSSDTADLIESWFNSKTASRVGKKKWDKELISQAIENGGGGWHGKGWLGSGKWTVRRSLVGSDGFCKSCGEKLVTIDLDPEEKEKFAESVASLALQREKHSSFENFQKWLEYYGPFEAVVDAANIGLYSQRNFKPSKVNAVVNGIRQMIPSRKWPLIVLHNRRITGGKMDEPLNRTLIEKWKNADALYATPTGSNDDWYWLYAAIKCRCLLVTNDEMRDHLFQLLGNDFFPKWKERHQVHFSFTESGPEIRMPPPCSVVIQESEKCHWHIPIVSEVEQEDQRIWLCCTRANSSLEPQEDSHLSLQKKEEARKKAPGKNNNQLELPAHGSEQRKQKSQDSASNIKTVVASSASENNHSILAEIEAAENLGSCLIDFQI